jgi:hypothetical protein
MVAVVVDVDAEACYWRGMSEGCQAAQLAVSSWNNAVQV